MVTRQAATGNGELYIPAACNIPGGFKSVELGLSVYERPSIFMTARTLDRDNEKRIARFENDELKKALELRKEGYRVELPERKRRRSKRDTAPRTFVPMDPNRNGRREEAKARREKTRETGRDRARRVKQQIEEARKMRAASV